VARGQENKLTIRDLDAAGKRVSSAAISTFLYRTAKITATAGSGRPADDQGAPGLRVAIVSWPATSAGRTARSRTAYACARRRNASASSSRSPSRSPVSPWRRHGDASSASSRANAFSWKTSPSTRGREKTSEFAKTLASYADGRTVNDAFGTAHPSPRSTEGIAHNTCRRMPAADGEESSSFKPMEKPNGPFAGYPRAKVPGRSRSCAPVDKVESWSSAGHGNHLHARPGQGPSARACRAGSRR